MKLEEYLNLPENERLYSDGLAILKEHGLPMFAPEFAHLQAGPMGNNRRRLFDVLAKIPENKGPIVRAEITVQSQDAYAQNIAPSSRAELDLMLQLRRQKQQRAKCSQQFHSCDTDAERAEVCTLIDKATEAMRDTEKRLAYVQRHGRLPEIETEPAEPLPDDPEELEKIQFRLSSQILKVEKRIVYLLALPANSPKRKQLREKEALLHKLTARKTAVRLKRKAISLQDEPEENAA